MVTKPKIYTEEFVKKELQDMYEEAMNNPDYVILGELFESRSYSSQRFREWSKEFSDSAEISASIKKIKDLFEHRVNIGGLKNKLNPTMVIFNLKNNYGWKDQQLLDHTTKGESLNQIKLTIVDGTQHPEALSEPVHKQD